MAPYNSTFGYHQPPSDSAPDCKQSAFADDEDSAVLDPSILDADMMQSPNNTSAFRKDSFANSNGVLSPADSQAWDHQYPNAGPLTMDPATATAPNPFQDDPNLYMRPHSNQAPTAFAQHHHQPSWTFDHPSGNCTPTTNGDFMPPPNHFDPAPHYVHSRADSAHGTFGHAPSGPLQFAPQHPEVNFIPAPQVQAPMSPHSHQDWMGMAQQEMEGRTSSKRMRPASPPRNIMDFQRRDGIRKKNGRIDIPQERNIATIDDLIERTTDEEMLKELKQQKRLLRNREAA
jgi:hypothetical protein